MKLRILCVLLLYCTMSACHQIGDVDNKKPEIINIKKAFEKKHPIYINDISIDFKYIMLETTNESLVGKNFTVYSDDQNLVVIDKKRILLFDRGNGRFIRTIGKSGNGPNEYLKTYTIMPFNEESKTVYAGRHTNRIEYTLDGQTINTVKGPESLFEFVNFDENKYVSFIDNYMGNEKKKLVIFNNKDSIFNIFPNYLSFQFRNEFHIISPNAWFYKLKKQLFFCEKFNDTLFNVTPQFLIPRLVFDKGKFTMPYDLRGGTIPVDKYFITENVLESTKYLFYIFSFNKMIYTALFDKEHKTTIINDYGEESGKGYVNNINDFVPLELSSINGKGELICTIDAFKIKLWIEKNAEKFEKFPEYLKKLKSISESDNPVVMIAKLRE